MIVVFPDHTHLLLIIHDGGVFFFDQCFSDENSCEYTNPDITIIKNM